MNAACVENYVVSCNPPPKTPASEVVVHRTDEPLATTGATYDPTLTILGAAAIIIGAITLGRRAKNHRSTK